MAEEKLDAIDVALRQEQEAQKGTQQDSEIHGSHNTNEPSNYETKESKPDLDDQNDEAKEDQKQNSILESGPSETNINDTKSDSDTSDTSDSESDSESYSESDSESDSDSDESSESNLEDVMPQESDNETEIPRTRNEILEDTIPQVPEDLQLNENTQVEPVGVIKAVGDRSVVIEAHCSARYRVLAEGAVLVIRSTDPVLPPFIPLGVLYETFGPVDRPYYVVKFKEEADLEPFKSKVGENALQVVATAKYVRTDEFKSKGTDASNFNDEEVPLEEQEFSDDEQEMLAKAAKNKKRKKNKKPTTTTRDTDPITDVQEPAPAPPRKQLVTFRPPMDTPVDTQTNPINTPRNTLVPTNAMPLTAMPPAAMPMNPGMPMTPEMMQQWYQFQQFQQFQYQQMFHQQQNQHQSSQQQNQHQSQLPRPPPPY